ncbi:vWA domain-containing protein, partial [Thiohalomonas denitrificans]|uniref:vWA domain-containing protein n=1 Tax=Thiohalomonas denitrificans TaxID=415747 RepID=UPI003983C2A8
MSNDVETKLSAARTRLILDKPFLGALVLRLPMIAADKGWCPTTATDARAFYYNPDYIEGMNLEQTKFILAHEALHCGLSHFARRLHRQKHRWDVACDLAVNPILISEGLTPAQDALYVEEFNEMTAEEIYPCLDDHPDSQTPDQHLYDDDSSEGGTRGGGSGEEGRERGAGTGRPDKPTETGEGGGSESREGENTKGGSDQP